MAYTLTNPPSEKCELTPKNRVWGFFENSNRTRPANRRKPSELRRKIRLTPTKIASGIPYWPSRDPIEEAGGINLYSGLANNPISNIDPDGRVNVPGIFIGIGIDLTLQITTNVASGEDWYNIDVTSVLISGAIGAVFPGVGKIGQGIGKGLNAQAKAIRAGEKLARRAKGNFRRHVLNQKAKAAMAAEKEAWKKLGQVTAAVAAGQLTSRIANEIADDIEEHFEKNCPAEVNEHDVQTLPTLRVTLDAQGNVIDASMDGFDINIGPRGALNIDGDTIIEE